MGEDLGPQLDVRALLDAVDAAAPANAVDEVAELFGARRVAFLMRTCAAGRWCGCPPRIAAKVPGGRPPDESEVIELSGTVYERVLQSQEPAVEVFDGHIQMVAPVTDRGDAIGVLEMALPEPPGKAALGELAAAGHALAFIVIAGRRSPTCTHGASGPCR